MMQNEIPHYLRFARALALVGGVACAGCGATVTSQDVPPTETAVVDAGIVVAPDRGPPVGAQPSPDVGIAASPDVVVSMGVRPAPDATAMDLDATSDGGGTLDRPYYGEGGPQVAPELPWA